MTVMPKEFNTVGAVVLAAGNSTRMHSRVPKAAMPVNGELMLNLVLSSLRAAGVSKICTVISRRLLPYLDRLDLDEVTLCMQEQPLGSGHALASALVAFRTCEAASIGDRALYRGAHLDCQRLLICPVDIPAVSVATIRGFLRSVPDGAAVLAMRCTDPRGYGRIIAENGILQRIVEERDADTLTRQIELCNSGVLLLPLAATPRLLSHLHCENAQREFYLTDIFSNITAAVHVASDPSCLQGVNDQQQLAAVEELLRTREQSEL